VSRWTPLALLLLIIGCPIDSPDDDDATGADDDDTAADDDDSAGDDDDAGDDARPPPGREMRAAVSGWTRTSPGPACRIRR